MYLPEAVVQSVISLAVTTPFRMGLGGLGGSWALGVGVSGGCLGEVVRAAAVGLFSAGFALEVLADWQLGEFKEKAESHGKMCREGVWSVVRHPK
jgi:protein-S-isoprenylcysteine O-methyltransferase Ste14